MSAIQSNTHVFIVKIWLDHEPEQAQPAKWRGRITHVPSDQQRHFSDLTDIAKFIVPYLHQMGARQTILWKLKYWWGR